MRPEQFTKAYADALPAPTPAQLRAQEQRLLERKPRRPSFLGPERLLYTVALVVVTLVASAAWLSATGQGSEAQRAGAELAVEMAGSRLMEGVSVAASSGSAAAELAFSDGTRLTLQPGSEARIERIGHGRVELSLHHGRLLARVRKATGITWSIAAGPYAVQVIGTEFTLDYALQPNTIAVSVSAGRVRVTGGNIPAPGLVLDPGSSFEKTSAPPEPVVAAPALTEPQAEPEPQAADDATRVNAVAPRSRPPGRASPSGWKKLARLGDYRGALRLAQRQRVVERLERLPAVDLLLLGDTARLGGDAKLAELTYLTARRRFAGTREASLAAFSLGRLAYDQTRDNQRAAEWFEAFLAEAPTGDLAAGARARLMELWVNAGDLSSAANVARRYLRYHPAGPHVGIARSLVDRARQSSDAGP